MLRCEAGLYTKPSILRAGTFTACSPWSSYYIRFHGLLADQQFVKDKTCLVNNCLVNAVHNIERKSLAFLGNARATYSDATPMCTVQNKLNTRAGILSFVLTMGVQCVFSTYHSLLKRAKHSHFNGNSQTISAKRASLSSQITKVGSMTWVVSGT